MSPNTHIINHCGPTNKKLRFHLPLLGVEGSQLRVANQTRSLHTDQPYLFDDSFDHEVITSLS
jgi:aspartate beta-hydroxylase